MTDEHEQQQQWRTTQQTKRLSEHQARTTNPESQEKTQEEESRLTGLVIPVALSMPSELTVAIHAVFPTCWVAEATPPVFPTDFKDAEARRRLLRSAGLAVKAAPLIMADISLFCRCLLLLRCGENLRVQANEALPVPCDRCRACSAVESEWRLSCVV